MIVGELNQRWLDLDDFPPGSRVLTPTGRLGTVLRHRGWASKRDHAERVIVRYDGENRRDTVALLPGWLRLQDKSATRLAHAEIMTISEEADNKSRKQ